MIRHILSLYTLKRYVEDTGDILIGGEGGRTCCCYDQQWHNYNKIIRNNENTSIRELE